MPGYILALLVMTCSVMRFDCDLDRALESESWGA